MTTTKDGNAVLLPEEDYSGIAEASVRIKTVFYVLPS